MNGIASDKLLWDDESAELKLLLIVELLLDEKLDIDKLLCVKLLSPEEPDIKEDELLVDNIGDFSPPLPPLPPQPMINTESDIEKNKCLIVQPCWIEIRRLQTKNLETKKGLFL